MGENEVIEFEIQNDKSQLHSWFNQIVRTISLLKYKDTYSDWELISKCLVYVCYARILLFLAHCSSVDFMDDCFCPGKCDRWHNDFVCTQ